MRKDHHIGCLGEKALVNRHTARIAVLDADTVAQIRVDHDAQTALKQQPRLA